MALSLILSVGDTFYACILPPFSYKSDIWGHTHLVSNRGHNDLDVSFVDSKTKICLPFCAYLYLLSFLPLYHLYPCCPYDDADHHHHRVGDDDVSHRLSFAVENFSQSSSRLAGPTLYKSVSAYFRSY